MSKKLHNSLHYYILFKTTKANVKNLKKKFKKLKCSKIIFKQK